MVGMKRILPTFIAFACISATLPAQTVPDNPAPAESSSADWNNVVDLAHDEQIIVRADGGRSTHCLFSGAIDSTLYCDPYLSTANGGQYRFPRAEVEQVRINQQRRNQKIIFWSFTAAGFIWGVSGPASSFNGLPRALGGFAGGTAGALSGLLVSFPTSLLIPGKLIYRRPANVPQSPSTKSTHHHPFRSTQ
jgi:hypothetical protein